MLITGEEGFLSPSLRRHYPDQVFTGIISDPFRISGGTPRETLKTNANVAKIFSNIL